MSFTQEEKDLIFGTLLGDGNLSTETQGRNWRYRALQAEKHKDYLIHKYNVLGNYVESPPTLSSYFDDRTNKTYERYSFNTKTTGLDQLKFYGDMFYKWCRAPKSKIGKMRKIVPSYQNLMSNLTPRAIAYWYMDDGAVKWVGHSNAMRICSESFTNDENQRLVNVFKKKYNIVLTLTKKNILVSGIVTPRKRIVIPEKSSEAFRNLILAYLTIPCMRYKMTDGKKGQLS